MTAPYSDRETSSEMREYATAIGLLCMYWSTLDTVINRFIQNILKTDEATAACVVSTSRDTSQRCEIAKRLVIHKASSPKWNIWRSCAIGLLDLVQNKLCDKRNRFVHDDWDFSEDKIVRLDTRVKVWKPQAGLPDQLVLIRPHNSEPKDLYDLTALVIETFVHLTYLGNAFHQFDGGPFVPEPPEQAVRLSKLNSLEDYQSLLRARQPPQKSSAE